MKNDMELGTLKITSLVLLFQILLLGEQNI